MIPKDKELLGAISEVLMLHGIATYDIDQNDNMLTIRTAPPPTPELSVALAMLKVPCRTVFKLETLPKDWNKAREQFEKFVDPVNHPTHYNRGSIEVIEFIEDQKLDYYSGNTVKYICRAGKKDPTKEIEDLEKGMWYLARKIEVLKAEREGRAALRPNEMKK